MLEFVCVIFLEFEKHLVIRLVYFPINSSDRCDIIRVFLKKEFRCLKVVMFCLTTRRDALNLKPKPGFPGSGPPISQFPGSGENREIANPT